MFSLIFIPVEERVRRRRVAKWSVSYVSANLSNVQLHLFGDSSKPASDTFDARDDSDSFFLGLHRLTYTRESTQVGIITNMDYIKG